MNTMKLVRSIGRRLFFCWILGLLALPVYADDNRMERDAGRFTLRGFGTLGLARSDSDTAEYVRDLSQPRGLTRRWSSRTDSVLGLQGNLKLGERTEGVVQVLSRYRYDGSHDPEIAWAFLRHDFSPDVQVRVGRLGTEFYMLADSRLIGYANTTVRPPPDFYGLLIFNHFDGIDATVGVPVGTGLWRAKLFYGRSPETTPFVTPLTWKLDGTRLRGGHLDYFDGPWQFRIARAEARFSSHEAPLNALLNPAIAADPALSAALGALLPLDVTALFPELSMAGTRSRFDSLGAVYDRGPVRIHAMVGRIRHESESYEDSRSAFITGAYRIGRFTPYLGYSVARSKAGTIATVPSLPGGLGVALNQLAAAYFAPQSHIDRHTVTLGARWDFREDWALKLQFDAVRGRPESVSPFRSAPGSPPQWNGRMNILSATLDFVF